MSEAIATDATPHDDDAPLRRTTAHAAHALLDLTRARHARGAVGGLAPQRAEARYLRQRRELASVVRAWTQCMRSDGVSMEKSAIGLRQIIERELDVGAVPQAIVMSILADALSWMLAEYEAPESTG
jgi:hypothetical protein